jgi:hypothetical protein
VADGCAVKVADLFRNLPPLYQHPSIVELLFGVFVFASRECDVQLRRLCGEIDLSKRSKILRNSANTVESFKTASDLTNETGKLGYLRFLIDDHPFPAFEENVSKIGFLPADLARQVTQFYTYARSAVQDIRTLYSDNLYTWPIPAAVHFMEEMIKTIDASDSLAKDLIPQASSRSGTDVARLPATTSVKAPRKRREVDKGRSSGLRFQEALEIAAECQTQEQWYAEVERLGGQLS